MSDLWLANQDLAAACLAEPFVAGLASGLTPRADFAWYVGQDAFFLDVFIRAYALALAKSSDRQQMREVKDLLDGVLAELELHSGYAAQWGLDLTAVTPGPACLAYTDFLRSVAALEPLAYHRGDGALPAAVCVAGRAVAAAGSPRLALCAVGRDLCCRRFPRAHRPARSAVGRARR